MGTTSVSAGGGFVGGGSVFVGGGGGSVFVGGGGGGSVFVGGGSGVFVFGMGVLVALGGLCWVRVGKAMAAPSRGRRVGVGWRGVGEEKIVAVSEGRGVVVKEAVSVGTTVGVETNTLTACCVSATDVLRFSTTRSTMFSGRAPL